MLIKDYNKMNYNEFYTKYIKRPLKAALFIGIAEATVFAYGARTHFSADKSLNYLFHNSPDLLNTNSTTTFNLTTSFNINNTYHHENTNEVANISATILADFFALGTMLTVQILRTYNIWDLFYGKTKTQPQSFPETDLPFNNPINNQLNEVLIVRNTQNPIFFKKNNRDEIDVFQPSKKRKLVALAARMMPKTIGILNLITTAVCTYPGLIDLSKRVTGSDDMTTNQIIAAVNLTAYMVTMWAFARKIAFDNGDELSDIILKKREFKFNPTSAVRTFVLATPNVLATAAFNYYGTSEAIAKLPPSLAVVFESQDIKTSFVKFCTTLGFLHPLVTFVPAIYKHNGSTISIPNYESEKLKKISFGTLTNPIKVFRNTVLFVGTLDAIGSGFCGNVKSFAYMLYNASDKKINPYGGFVITGGVILGISGAYTTITYAVMGGLSKMLNILKEHYQIPNKEKLTSNEENLNNEDDLYYTALPGESSSLIRSSSFIQLGESEHSEGTHRNSFFAPSAKHCTHQNSSNQAQTLRVYRR